MADTNRSIIALISSSLMNSNMHSTSATFHPMKRKWVLHSMVLRRVYTSCKPCCVYVCLVRLSVIVAVFTVPENWLLPTASKMLTINCSWLFSTTWTTHYISYYLYRQHNDYLLRPRRYNRELSCKSYYDDNNFITTMLYKNIYWQWSTFSSSLTLLIPFSNCGYIFFLSTACTVQLQFVTCI